MLKVLVVEDEEMIRRGIVLAVDWAALDCVVVGEAAASGETTPMSSSSLHTTASPTPRAPCGWGRWTFSSSPSTTETWSGR